METAVITQIEVKFQVRWIPAGNGRDCPSAPDTPAQQSSSSTPPSSPVGSGGRPEPERPPPLPEFQSASSWTENVSGGSQWCRLKCTHSSPLCFGPPPVSHTLLVQTCSHGWSLTSVWKTTPSFLWYLKSLPLLRTLSLSFLSTCFLFLSSFTKPMVCPLCSAGLFRTSTDPPERWCFLFSPPGTGLLTALGESFLIFLLFSLGLEENAQPRSGHPQGDFVLSSWSQRSWMHRMQKLCWQGIVTGLLRTLLQIVQQRGGSILTGTRGSATSVSSCDKVGFRFLLVWFVLCVSSCISVEMGVAELSFSSGSLLHIFIFFIQTHLTVLPCMFWQIFPAVISDGSAYTHYRGMWGSLHLHFFLTQMTICMMTFSTIGRHTGALTRS